MNPPQDTANRKPRVPPGEERLVIIRAAVARGETFRDIGASLGLSFQRIAQICAVNGVEPSGNRSKASEAISRQMTALWADPAKREARLWAIRLSGRVHSKDIVSKVVALKGKKSASQIAREMGLKSRTVVIGIWHRNTA